jgi:hypothetical protein
MISPVFGCGEMIEILLEAEGNKKGFGVGLLFDKFMGYKLINFFYFCLVETLVTLVLGIYLFLVYPIGIGQNRHPLFFLRGFFKTKQEVKVRKVSRLGEDRKVNTENSVNEKMNDELMSE